MTTTTTLMRTFTFFKCDSIVIAERRSLMILHIQKIQKASGIDDQVCVDLMDMSKYRYIVKITTISIMSIQLSPPPFSNFLFTYLFSIKFLYFVIMKFHLFSLILACSYEYSYNLMLTATIMFRSFFFRLKHGLFHIALDISTIL